MPIHVTGLVWWWIWGWVITDNKTSWNIDISGNTRGNLTSYIVRQEERCFLICFLFFLRKRLNMSSGKGKYFLPACIGTSFWFLWPRSHKPALNEDVVVAALRTCSLSWLKFKKICHQSDSICKMFIGFQSVQLGQHFKSGTPVVEEVIINIWVRGAWSQRA